MKEFKGIWIPYEIVTDIKLNDKEKMVYSMILYLSKENSKEIALRKMIPICKYDNTYKQINIQPINKDVKGIKSNNKIFNKNNWKCNNEKDYSNFDWTSLYANRF